MSASSDPFTPAPDQSRTSPYVNVRFNQEQRVMMNRMKVLTGDTTDAAFIKRAIGALYRELYPQNAGAYRESTPQED